MNTKMTGFRGFKKKSLCPYAFDESSLSFGMEWLTLVLLWLIWPIQNDAKKQKNDWNLGTWVLI